MRGLSVKASLPTLKVAKEAFTDPGSLKESFTDRHLTPGTPKPPATPHVTAGAREGPLHAAQPRKLALHARPKYMKGSFTEPGASKGAFMYRTTGAQTRAIAKVPCSRRRGSPRKVSVGVRSVADGVIRWSRLVSTSASKRRAS
ncbi:hypothetical protein GCM10027598_15590 [Amycolatopsis oliviviridis]|uniref:Uncharacterized protein n=1 Tax=Amycolatopsis oliviviridis TaxID=1471590 RepID=A0ABQ3LSU6_9PSEU|nr:hypothetical protein GCM10017790_50550 [Amycolatopsis oliviviridis]